MFANSFSAQRLSASLIGSPTWNAAGGASCECSTPFGITDRITAAISRRTGVPIDMCSTPFGITDRITGATRGGHAPDAECSTPFGITDRITGRVEHGDVVGAGVLNAFRHH